MAAPETSTCEPWATIADVQSPCDDYASADRDTDAQLLLGRDDGLTVWLNGQELYKAHGPFSIDRQEFAVDARLVKGINRILVKSTQGGGEWQFYLRVTDRKGAPLKQE